jgi:KDO2-lipid IV(A) lauroyltransferase
VSRVRDLFETAVHEGLKLLPTERASALGSFITRTNVRLFLKQVIAGARHNLRHHHPHLSDQEIDDGVQRFLDNVGRLMGEYSVLHRLHDEGRLVYGDGLKQLASEQGQYPVVSIALHIGNWEVMGAGLHDLGIKTATFYEPPASEVQRRIVIEVRKRFGFQLLTPDLKGLRTSLALLKDNGFVFMFGDEARGGRTMAPLFGRQAHDDGNLSIIARLARKSNARLNISYVERLPNCRFHLQMTEMFRLPDTMGQTIIDDVAFLNAKIEPIILDHLDSWYFLDDSLEPIAR